MFNENKLGGGFLQRVLRFGKSELKAKELGFGGFGLGLIWEVYVDKLLGLLHQGREIEHGGRVVIEGATRE